MAFVSQAGYRVEEVALRRALNRPARPALRVTWHGFFVADCASVEQVAQQVDLAELTEAEVT